MKIFINKVFCFLYVFLLLMAGVKNVYAVEGVRKTDSKEIYSSFTYKDGLKVSSQPRKLFGKASAYKGYGSSSKKSYADAIEIDIGQTITSSFFMQWYSGYYTSLVITHVNLSGAGFTRGPGCPVGTSGASGICTFPIYFTPTTTDLSVGVATVTYSWVAGTESGTDTEVYTLKVKGVEKIPKNKVCAVGGSIINPVERTVIEEVPIVGTNINLQYNSRLAEDHISTQGDLIPIAGYNQEGWVLSIHKSYSPNKKLFSGSEVYSAKYIDIEEATFKFSKKRKKIIKREQCDPEVDEDCDIVCDPEVDVDCDIECDPEFEDCDDGPVGYIYVVSQSGDEVYAFDYEGKHAFTKTFLTGAVKYKFNYTDDLLSSVEDAYSNTMQIQRDVNGYISKIIAPYGQETLFTVNASGKITSITNPNSDVYSMTYKAGTDLLESFTKPGGQTTTFTYNSEGHLIKDLGYGGNFWQLDKDSSGNIKRTSALGLKTEYSKSFIAASGEITQQMKDPTSLITTMSEDNTDWSKTSNLISETEFQRVDDERFGETFKRISSSSYKIGGVKSSTAYNQTYVSGAAVGIFDYDSLVSTQTTSGRVVTTEFDNISKTLTESSPMGVEVVTQFDINERPLSTTYGSYTPVSYNYDIQGRLVEQVQGTKNQLIYTYGVDGYVSKITNARLENTSFLYDLAGRLVQTTLPDTRIIAYEYDDNGNLTGVTPPGRPKHILGYNAMELSSSYKSPLVTTTTAYGYNLDKQLTSISKSNGKTATYTYNATSGLLTQVASTAGNYVYAYSSVVPGLLSSVSSPYGVKNSYSYRGPVVLSDQQIRSSDNTVMGKVSFGFDSSHRVVSRTVTDSTSANYTRNYVLNDDDQPTQVGDMSITYDSINGVLSSATLGRITDSWTYDSYGNLASYASVYNPTSGPSVTLYSYTLTRDIMSRIDAVTEVIGSTTNNYEYEYDVAGRLTEAKKNSVVVASFVCDSNSNRTSQTIGSVTTAAVFDNEDRMTSFGSKTYTYDNNGDLIETENSLGAHEYFTYDVFGNLTQATPTSSTVYNYIYDGNHRMVGKATSSTVSRRYLYQDQLRVVAQLNGSGVLEKEFVYATGAHTPDYMISGGNKYRIITNHLGSPRLVVNISTGAIAQEIDYNVLGKVLSDTSPDFQPFGFAGGLYDQDTKLVRFGARAYDAETGRWTTKDPILFSGGDTNLYGYVLNDPVNFVDPNGRWAQIPLAMLGGGFIGGVTGAITQHRLNPNSTRKDYVRAIASSAVITAGAAGLAASGAGLIAGAAAQLGGLSYSFLSSPGESGVNAADLYNGANTLLNPNKSKQNGMCVK